MNTYTVPGEPVAKPRMTRQDKWIQRPKVVKYRGYADRVRLFCKGRCGGRIRMVFYMPLPNSYSKKKKAEMAGTPHLGTPDCDNMIKGVCDALMGDDRGIWYIEAAKYWEDAEGPRTVISY